MARPSEVPQSYQPLDLPPAEATAPQAAPQPVAPPEMSQRPHGGVFSPVRALAARLSGAARRGVRVEIDEPSFPVTAEDASAPLPTSEALSQRGEQFWGDEAYVQRPPSFADQLAAVRADPGSRAARLTTKPSAILGTIGYIGGRRTKLTFSEGEGILDMDDFLAHASEIARADSSDEGRAMEEQVGQFGREVHLLGSHEYATACEGIAEMWTEYVAQGPDYVLNLADKELPDGYMKSHTVVTRDILARFLERVKDTDLGGRLRLKPEDWIDGEHARLVVVDDWATSGHTVGSLVDAAIAKAKRVGLPGLAEKTEAHVLIARPGQAGQREHRNPYQMRAFYQVEGDRIGRTYPISGAHSSVDYAFELPLDRLRAYMQQKGYEREAPLLTDLQRPYQPEAALSDPRAVDILTRTASLNGEVSRLHNEQGVLRDQMAGLEFTDEMSDRLTAIEVLLDNDYKELRGLHAAYDRLAASDNEWPRDNTTARTP